MYDLKLLLNWKRISSPFAQTRQNKSCWLRKERDREFSIVNNCQQKPFEGSDIWTKSLLFCEEVWISFQNLISLFPVLNPDTFFFHDFETKGSGSQALEDVQGCPATCLISQNLWLQFCLKDTSKDRKLGQGPNFYEALTHHHNNNWVVQSSSDLPCLSTYRGRARPKILQTDPETFLSSCQSCVNSSPEVVCRRFTVIFANLTAQQKQQNESNWCTFQLWWQKRGCGYFEMTMPQSVGVPLIWSLLCWYAGYHNLFASHGKTGAFQWRTKSGALFVSVSYACKWWGVMLPGRLSVCLVLLHHCWQKTSLHPSLTF